MKFLFINSVNSSMEVETKYPPLGIGYLVSSLRKRFGNDAIEFKIVVDDIEQEIKDFRPDIVGISSVSQNFNRAITYAKIAKKYELPVLCGGVHITMMPNSLTEDMDVGIMGEGEETLCDLVELFAKKGRLDTDDLSRIKGIIHWDGREIASTGVRHFISPLDQLPFPARDLLNIGPVTYMFTSRGCPYRCTFCASTRFWNKTRYFSAEYVVDEIVHLVDTYRVKTIHFFDDLFPANMERTIKILNILRGKNYLGKVEFITAIRANLVRDETIKLLKELGVKGVGMGLESGCEETLKYLKGGNVSVNDNENAVTIVKKYGIFASASFIIGSPQEDKDNILATLNFIKRSSLDSFEVYVLTPFPGTPVWDYALSKGLVSENMDWSSLNVDFENNYNSAIILSEKLNREELHALFLQFSREIKIRYTYSLVKYALLNPWKIPRYLIKRITSRKKTN